MTEPWLIQFVTSHWSPKQSCSTVPVCTIPPHQWQYRKTGRIKVAFLQRGLKRSQKYHWSPGFMEQFPWRKWQLQRVAHHIPTILIPFLKPLLPQPLSSNFRNCQKQSLKAQRKLCVCSCPIPANIASVEIKIQSASASEKLSCKERNKIHHNFAVNPARVFYRFACLVFWKLFCFSI